MDSAGSRSLGVNELLGRRVQDGQAFQESHAAKTWPRSGEAEETRAVCGGDPVEGV